MKRKRKGLIGHLALQVTEAGNQQKSNPAALSKYKARYEIGKYVYPKDEVTKLEETTRYDIYQYL